MTVTAAPPRFGRADSLVLFTALLWGLNFPIAKHVLLFLPPMVFASVRFFLASGILFLLLLARGDNLRISRGDFWRLLGLGLLGITLFQAMWSNGLTLTTASKGSVILNTSPVWAALFVSLMGQAPSLRGWIGILASFFGTFLVINNSLTHLTLGGGTLAGDLMFLGGAVFWALYSLLGVGVMSRVGPLKATAYAMLLGAILLLPFGLYEVPAMDFPAVPLSAWAGFAFTIVLSAALGFVWWYEGIRVLGITRVMVYSYLVPVFAVVTAVVFLGENFGPTQVLGAVIVLGGVQLARGA